MTATTSPGDYTIPVDVVFKPNASTGPRPPLYTDAGYADYREGRLDSQNAQRAPQTQARQKGKDMKTFWQVLGGVLAAVLVLFVIVKLFDYDGWQDWGAFAVCETRGVPVGPADPGGVRIRLWRECH